MPDDKTKLTVVPTAADDIAGDWDDAHTLEVLTLPGGKRVQVRPVSLLSMIANGTIPNTLLDAAKRSMDLGGPSAAGGAGADVDAQSGVELIDFMVCEMTVTPHFVPKRRAECATGERSVYEMWDSDKMWLFTHAMQGQAALKSGGAE